MRECYFCKNIINKENASLEHIIPNVLGGKLKSKEILCKECNNKLSNIDKRLADNFNFINVLANPKTDRKIKNQIPAKIGEQNIILKPNMQFFTEFKPQITKTNKGKFFYIKGSFNANNKDNEEIFYKKVQTILKNNGVEMNIQKIREVTKLEQHQQPIIFCDVSINFNSILIGYLKIAIGFCSLKNRDIHIQPQILELFKNFDFDQIKNRVAYIDSNKLKNGRLCHHIYLVGDQKNKKFFCIVSIYNFLDIAIILNDNYNDENFQEQYCYDIINNKEISDAINIKFSYSDIKDNIAPNIDSIRKILGYDYIMKFFIGNQQVTDAILQLFDYIVATYEKILNKSELRDIIQDSFEKARIKQKFLNLTDEAIGVIANLSHNKDIFEHYLNKHNTFNDLLNKNSELTRLMNMLAKQIHKTMGEIRKIALSSCLQGNIWLDILDHHKVLVQVT